MKKLLLALTFSVALTSPAFAKWTWVSANVRRDSYYVDFDRIRKHDNYVYFWDLLDLLNPESLGILSLKSYKQADCRGFRYKRLTVSFHREPMGEGWGESITPENEPWRYPPPGSSDEEVLKRVCNHQ